MKNYRFDKELFVTYARLMKKYIILAVIIIFVIGIFYFFKNSLNLEKKTEVKPSLSPPITTTYKGRQPCADCSGIEETLILVNDNSYTDTLVYKDKDTTTTIKGTWTNSTGTLKDQQASVLELTPETGNKSFYVVKENKLYPLDQNKEEINAPFDLSLTKQ